MRLALLLIASSCLFFSAYGNATSGSTTMMMASVSMTDSAPQKSRLKIKNRQQATQTVKDRYPGKVLSVQSTRINGNPGYRAKILSDDGVIFYVTIDAASGRVQRD
ncbi:PepSY domain-containing protein [Shewanella sp. AS1]|uniref:PepSY domain-containing protein n=1 Tax=Shewanella sp. AS1 TaxID=2907626 RepID=UPI001F2B03C3|nr:PepSY domain-containing protein [Shewanella sp. AS1]MCE9678131.1 PepSY domain-containing protein [Shewanella sp. AS1]